MRTRSDRVRRRWLALAAWLSASALPALGQAPPRYRLRVGDWLVYQRRARVFSLETGEVRQRDTDQIQLGCLERDARTNELLVLLDVIPASDGQAGPTQGVVLHLDERGQKRVPDVEQTRVAELDFVFDVVPELRAALDAGPHWQTTPDLYGRRWRCTPVQPATEDSGTLRYDFVREDPTGVAEALGQTRSGSFWFDPGEGVVTRVEARDEDRTAGLRTQTVFVLDSRGVRAGPWCAHRADDARRYLLTLRHEDRFFESVLRRPEQMEQTLPGLDRVWSAFLADADRHAESPLAFLASHRRRQLPTDIEQLRARGRYAARWLARTAPAWSLQTPDGETVASESLRGRPVIECLWSAESLWGLRALESLRRLQSELAGRPVRIVCLNMDRDVTRAYRAVQLCGRDLTHVLAGPLRDLEAPLEFPTIRVVDARGTIQAVILGWQPSYREAVEAALRASE